MGAFRDWATALPARTTHRGETSGVGHHLARDDHRHQRGKVPLLRKSKSATQNFTTGIVGNVSFQNTDHNLIESSDTAFTVVSSTLFSPPVDGLYLVSATIIFQSAGSVAATRRIATLWDDTSGANVGSQASTPSVPTTGQDTNVPLVLCQDLLASHQYAIRARHDAAGAGTVIAVDVGSAFFAMWVGPSS